MPDTDYHALRDFLDRFPLGFPRTQSGVEIEILKRLFSEEEARLAVRLSPFLEDVGQLAERLGTRAETLAEELNGMVRKGLVFRVRRQGTVAYRAAPFMIGLYEYSVKRIDKELAALYAEYYEGAYLDEIGASDVPGFKVIPVEENIEASDALLPYQKLEESVRAARRIAVTDCVCRKESSLLGKGCDHPMETCLSPRRGQFQTPVEHLQLLPLLLRLDEGDHPEGPRQTQVPERPVRGRRGGGGVFRVRDLCRPLPGRGHCRGRHRRSRPHQVPGLRSLRQRLSDRRDPIGAATRSGRTLRQGR